MTLSPEERERRRQRALAMHAQPHPDDPNRRRFGGAQPNSGPRRQKRASEVAAERIARHGNLVADVFISAMQPGKPDAIRMQAARSAVEIEHKERELQLKEDRELDGRSDSELIGMLVQGALKLAASGAVKMDDVIDLPQSAVTEVTG